MGQEIADSHFDAEAFAEFQARVGLETALLGEWLAEGVLSDPCCYVGIELEGWLIDAQGRPAAKNDAFLTRLADPLVVPELARFNFELNAQPLPLTGGVLDRLYAELSARWNHCQATAGALDLRALMIGVLPTVGQSDLVLDNMSSLRRYRALNEQVFRLRGGRPLELVIDGVESLYRQHHSVMLEAAATSFQIHAQVSERQAVRAFNASKMLSAPLVGVSANAPYLFGRQLWEETRIPLFEQAVAVGQSDYSKRVTFGIRYARNSILECFEANRDRYPVLLPELMDEPRESLAHLRLHNGTIWRWNRPLVGFNQQGIPHLRIEHRVVPAGPSALDAVANLAFYFGLLIMLLRESDDLEARLPFEVARRNFYNAACTGLEADVSWLDGHSGPLSELVLDHLLPLAAQGLRQMGLGSVEIDRWLGIIHHRVASGQTGARWQIGWIKKHGRDFPALVNTYGLNQASETPVSQWAL